MSLRIHGLLLVALLGLAAQAKADWSVTTTIHEINIGGNGMHGAFVSLSNFSFSGCSSIGVVFLPASDPNYKELISSLLAAKLSERSVRVMYSGCSAGYSLLKEVVLP